MKSTKATAAKKTVNQPKRAYKPRTPKPAAAPQADKAWFQPTLDDIFDQMPSGKRVFAASAVSFILAFGAGYTIGVIAEIVAMGILVLTGSMLLYFVTWAIAILLSFYAGMKIGQHVGMYVLSGQIDRDIVSAKDYVKGLFSSKPVLA